MRIYKEKLMGLLILLPIILALLIGLKLKALVSMAEENSVQSQFNHLTLVAKSIDEGKQFPLTFLKRLTEIEDSQPGVIARLFDAKTMLPVIPTFTTTEDPLFAIPNDLIISNIKGRKGDFQFLADKDRVRFYFTEVLDTHGNKYFYVVGISDNKKMPLGTSIKNWAAFLFLTTLVLNSFLAFNILQFKWDGKTERRKKD